MLKGIGYDRELARWAAAADARIGRVLRVQRGVATILTEKGEVRASYGGRLLGWIAADSAEAPCAGDWAVLRDWRDGRVTVERLVPRRTAVTSCVGGHVLAANVDVVAVLAAADTMAADPGRLEPLIAVARASGARPVVVLTRCDLVDEVPTVAGCDVIATSAVTGVGVSELRDLLERHLTLAMVGAPGQGKSSLMRALVGDLAVRRARTRTLHVLPEGGAVIDTPSLRAVA